MTHQIEGPFPLTVRPTNNGAELDISRFLVRAVFLELFAQAAEDPQGFGEEFADMYALSQSAQVQGRGSHARHEFDERMGQMLDAYADGGTVPLYTGGVHQLRDAVTQIAAPRPVPAQERRRTA